MSPNNKFPARLRIKSRKQIELLFENKLSLFAHPFLLKYHFTKLEGDQLAAPKFAVSVPKRAFKKAHDRNLLKRRIREAYRLHWKLYLPEMSNYEALFMFIYIGKTIADYQEIEHGLIQVFKKLEKLNDRT
ncbi:MAG: ribonuclease P protein component [Saprospiraceae bacterium]|nr:ribonuclease P protein component [Saprospiraceae bacterium]MBK9720209.1 ribonuclease P protein component [Saprospiraceae bacterium]